MFRSDARRKNLTFELKKYPGLPKRVKGDPARLRQIVSNITGNAVQHTSQGGVMVEVYATGRADDSRCDIEIAVQDTGSGMSPQKLDVLFREFEQVHSEDDDASYESEGDGATFTALSKIPGQKTLGLGLAIVARTVRNMKGQLRLKSEEGRGSRFTVCIPLSTIDEEQQYSNAAVESPAGGLTPPPPSGEVTLVDSSRRLQNRPSMHNMRRNSAGSSKSAISASSGTSGKSEIDRLVDAISSPHLLHESKSVPSRPNSSDGTANMVPTNARVNPSPGMISRSSSAGAALSVPSYQIPGPGSHEVPGQEYLQGEATPVKSIKVAEGTVYPDKPPPAVESSNSPAIKAPETPRPKKLQRSVTRNTPGGKPRPPPPPQDGPKLRVLVAEDDPINSKIMAKRLERMGHTIRLTVNGEECLEVFKHDGTDYDAILMDMQVRYTSRILGTTNRTDADHGRRHVDEEDT